MIVTIDGPAGAGKSTIARRLAGRLGFRFLDTGAMYRAVAWAALQAGVEAADAPRVESIARKLKLDLHEDQVLVDGQDVTEAIRTIRVTNAVPQVAAHREVRKILAQMQREIGRSGNIVTEGRDQGTAVFPDAECKVFLTASPEERAKRRYLELLKRGESITFGEVLESQNKRDQGDEQREVAPLEKASDAIEVITDEMSQNEVLVHLEWVVRSQAREI